MALKGVVFLQFSLEFSITWLGLLLNCFTVHVRQELAGALIADWRCIYLTSFFKISDALHMKEEQPSKVCLDT